MTWQRNLTRRRVLAATLSLAALSVVESAWAVPLRATPRQGAGPFYPHEIPLDSDNDLVNVAGRPRPASGTVAHVMGRVVDTDGGPISGTRVEIWQCDAFGVYHHVGGRGGSGADPNFQGFGSTFADRQGAYRFRTIKPVPYPGRTPHIHFALLGPGLRRMTTQLYIAGHPLNARDFVLNGIRDRGARSRVIAPFEPAPDIEAGAVAARFDIVIGLSI